MERKLPNNWVETEFKELTSFVIGGDWGKDLEFEFDVDSEIVSCIRGSEIKNWEQEKGSTASIRKIKSSSLEKRALVEGDILLEISGGGPDQPVGRTIYIDEEALQVNAEYEKVCTNFLRMVRLYDVLNKKFIKHYLDSFYLSGEILNYQGGSNNLRNLKYKEFETIKIPLPPLAEQQRIVAKLDELFGHLDSLKTRLEDIPQILKNFRQAVLTQAVTGKLTEEWREGKELEKIDYVKIHKDRIQEFDALKNENKKKGVKSPNKPEYLNHKIESVKSFNIASWLAAPVGFLCDCIVPGRDKPKSFTGDIPWITTPDLKSNFIYSNNARLFLSKAEVLEVRAKLIPKNSVVIIIVGRFGVSCVIKDACVINQQLHAFLPSEYVLPEYLMYYFKTQEVVMNSISTSTTIAYINKTKANSIVVNVPSKEEQTEIVIRVEALFAKADNIEAQYQSLKTKIDSLPQAVLAKAFKGELVEQLPTDGDARDLLEEIKKLKGSLRGTKQSVKRKKK